MSVAFICWKTGGREHARVLESCKLKPSITMGKVKSTKGKLLSLLDLSFQWNPSSKWHHTWACLCHCHAELTCVYFLWKNVPCLCAKTRSLCPRSEMEKYLFTYLGLSWNVLQKTGWILGRTGGTNAWWSSTCFQRHQKPATLTLHVYNA